MINGYKVCENVLILYIDNSFEFGIDFKTKHNSSNMIDKIKKYSPSGVTIIQQGPIVAKSLKNYLQRHPEMEERCSHGGTCQYCTTEDVSRFSPLASIFVNQTVEAHHVIL